MSTQAIALPPTTFETKSRAMIPPLLSQIREMVQSLRPIAAIYSDQLPVLSHIISQLRPGADLSRVTLPTFILEERSMLERITK